LAGEYVCAVVHEKLGHVAVAVLRSDVEDCVALLILGVHVEPLLAQQHLPRKVDVRLPGKGDSNSHGARTVHLTITMIKWIRTSRLSIKNSLSLQRTGC